MYILKSKNIQINPKIKLDSIKSIGDYYSSDRFYTLINSYIDLNISYKSKILAFIIKYLFKSGNYKHDPSIANGKSFGVKIVDIIAILSIIGFFAMIIAVLGLSFTVPNGVGGFVNFAEGFVKSLSGNITMLSIALILGSISVLWIVMYFSIRKKNKKLSLKDYVCKKVDYILKFSWLIKFSGKVKKSIFNKNEMNIHMLDNFEQQGSSNDRWLNLQLINLLASIFDGEFSLFFKFNNLSQEEYDEINKIINCDFKQIELLKINK